MLEVAGDLMLALDKAEAFYKGLSANNHTRFKHFLLFDMKRNQYRINRTLMPKT